MPEMSVKSRSELVAFIEEQLIGHDSKYDLQTDKKLRYHYGLQELRQLMDFLYGGEPEEGEELNVKTWVREEREQVEAWEAKQKEKGIGNYLQGSILRGN